MWTKVKKPSHWNIANRFTKIKCFCSIDFLVKYVLMYSMITQTKQTKKNTNVVNKVKEQIHCYDFLLENTSTHFINSHLPNLAQHYYNSCFKSVFRTRSSIWWIFFPKIDVWLGSAYVSGSYNEINVIILTFLILTLIK